MDIYDGLNAEFLVRLRGFEGACKAHGLHMSPREGYRDPARSDALYAAWIASGKKGPRAAPGGKSPHNFGLAMDYVCLDAGGQVIESSLAPEYGVMEEIAPRYALRTLRHLNDGGHVEGLEWDFHDVTGGSSVV